MTSKQLAPLVVIGGMIYALTGTKATDIPVVDAPPVESSSQADAATSQVPNLPEVVAPPSLDKSLLHEGYYRMAPGLTATISGDTVSVVKDARPTVEAPKAEPPPPKKSVSVPKPVQNFANVNACPTGTCPLQRRR